MNKLLINPHSKPYIIWLGNKEVPLFVIDDIFATPLEVRHLAFSNSFPSSVAYYPGRHQPLSQEDPSIKAFCHFIATVLTRATGKQIKTEAISTDFSILTTPEEKLLDNQGQPHIDGTPMLGVIYLNEQDLGGTVFFRNRETNSMTVVTEAQKAHYQNLSAQRKLDTPLGYVTDTNTQWEKVDTIEGKLNRLVIWPGNVFHSIDVKVNPASGQLDEKRLTQRVIINAIG
ncbi:DUF6445 family protein [Bowmanella sp. JS7-9]|uniref:DUF6445 family protein n=1 Tax=Pseudobowmanella zhangzhouensis TaxID=1537679 RepID=A0ABW1XH36_9ALTE|nr:DUF6445 family protein [Bowmanella sp. JS7-9]